MFINIIVKHTDQNIADQQETEKRTQNTPPFQAQHWKIRLASFGSLLKEKVKKHFIRTSSIKLKVYFSRSRSETVHCRMT